MTDRVRSPGPWRLPARSPLTALPRLLARHRRALTALCAGLATAAALTVVAPAPAETRPVVVAARRVSAGSALSADDLRVAAVPRAIAPADAVDDPAALVGRSIVIAAAPNTPVTAATVVAPDALRAAPGRALVPARLADPGLAAMVRVGDRVDLLALTTEGSAPRVVARGARVAAMPTAAPGGPFGGVDDTRGAALVFDVDDESAPALAQAASATRLTLVMRS